MDGVLIFDLPHKKNKNARLVFMTIGEKDKFLGTLYPRKKLFVIEKTRIGHIVNKIDGFGLNFQLFRWLRNRADKFRFDVNIEGDEDESKATYLISRMKIILKCSKPMKLGDEELQYLVPKKYCKKVNYKGR